jgi:glycoprotein endo-alpha-1,2-mannosidase
MYKRIPRLAGSYFPAFLQSKINSFLLGVLWLVLNACSDPLDVISPSATITDNAAKVDGSLTYQKVSKGNSAKIIAHYMPWFKTKEFSGSWGMHWTMANRNPDNMNASGKRDIAANYYPIIGPYDSNDPDLLMYHAILLKLSGIDGVFFDWYGTMNFSDWREIKTRTENAVAIFGKAGLEFGIVYEDYTLNVAVKNKLASSTVTAAQNDMSYLSNTFFNNPLYLKYNGKPVLLAFGPESLTSQQQWQSAFSVLPANQKPYFLPLWYHSQLAGSSSSGEFAWIAQDNLASLKNFYASRVKDINASLYFNAVYPGFDSYYDQGGWGGNWWSINHKNGQTLSETIQLAKNTNNKYIQLTTWNDFGEGTMLEPTQEFGYSYLKQIQQLAGVSYTEDDLKIAERFYKLRKKYKNDSYKLAQLEQVFLYICKLQLNKANDILNSLDLVS